MGSAESDRYLRVLLVDDDEAALYAKSRGLAGQGAVSREQAQAYAARPYRRSK